MTKTKRAYGRSLGDFTPLLIAEQQLLEACRMGQECRLNNYQSPADDFRKLGTEPSFFARSYAAAKSYSPPQAVDAQNDTDITFMEEFSKFTRNFSRGSIDQLHDVEVRELFQVCFSKFSSELAGWRAVVASDSTLVRGEFLRFLILGGDDQNPVHEYGVQLVGGSIVQDPAHKGLDLSGINIPYKVRLEGCLVSGPISFEGSTTRSLTLRASRIDGINLKSASVRGDIDLSDGLFCAGTLQLRGVSINGSLNCSGSTIDNPLGQTISGDSAEISGNLQLGLGFVSLGQVRLAGSRIDGQLQMSGGFLRTFQPMPDNKVHLRPRLAFVLDFQNLVVGSLFLSPILPSNRDPVRIIGSLNLVAAKATNLVFDPRSAPPNNVIGDRGDKLDCTVTLDGFQYSHLGVLYGNDVLTTMLALLKRQPSSHMGLEFRPQPHEQLSKTLLGMGRERDAKRVLQAKASALRYQEWLLLKRTFIERTNLPVLRGPRSPSRGRPFGDALSFTVWLAWPLILLSALLEITIGSLVLAMRWFIVNVFLGAGHRQSPTVIAFAILLIGSGWFYQEAAKTPGSFVPVDKAFARDTQNRQACGQAAANLPVNWAACTSKQIPELVEFEPYIYSIDLMLQVGPLGQKRAWEPAADATQPVLIKLPFLPSFTVGQYTLHVWTVTQSMLAIVLYILIARMVAMQIRDK